MVGSFEGAGRNSAKTKVSKHTGGKKGVIQSKEEVGSQGKDRTDGSDQPPKTTRQEGGHRRKEKKRRGMRQIRRKEVSTAMETTGNQRKNITRDSRGRK